MSHSNKPAFQHVFAKEIREMLRDKRVRNGALITPMAVMAMMVGLFGVIASSVGQNAKQKVALVTTGDPLAGVLRADRHLQITPISNEQDGTKLVKDGKTRVVIAIPEHPGESQTTIRFLFDPKEDSSQIAIAAVKQALAGVADDRQAAILKKSGLTKKDIEPIDWKEEPIKVGEGQGAGALVVSLLPYMLVLFTFSGGLSVAADMVAGEKEKSTLETLLITPVSRSDIVFGKFLSLSCVCLASAVSAVVGLLVCSVLPIGGAEAMFKGGFGLDAKSAIVILACIVPMVAFFASVLLAVSTYAKNSREAQTYMGTVYLIVLLPAVFSQVLGFTDIGSQMWVNFVPVLGTTANIRQAFQGKTNLAGVGESILVGVVLALIMFRIAVHLFNREEVLVRV